MFPFVAHLPDQVQKMQAKVWCSSCRKIRRYSMIFYLPSIYQNGYSDYACVCLSSRNQNSNLCNLTFQQTLLVMYSKTDKEIEYLALSSRVQKGSKLSIRLWMNYFSHLLKNAGNHSMFSASWLCSKRLKYIFQRFMAPPLSLWVHYTYLVLGRLVDTSHVLSSAEAEIDIGHFPFSFFPKTLDSADFWQFFIDSVTSLWSKTIFLRIVGSLLLKS